MTIKILALDMSSTTIGLCYDGSALETILLRGDISQKCKEAQRLIGAWLYMWPDVDMVVIESPVVRFASAVIPQARVSGAVLAELSRRNIAWHELAPQFAKMALTSKGNATKQMMMAACPQAADEHQADAYGLWRAACAIRIEKNGVLTT